MWWSCFAFLFFEDNACYLQGVGGYLQKTEIVWWSVPNFLGGEYVQSFPPKAIFARNMNVNPHPVVEFRLSEDGKVGIIWEDNSFNGWSYSF